MNKILCLLLIIGSFVSCKKNKVADKVDGSWYVSHIVNRSFVMINAGTIDFNPGGTGIFNLNYYNPTTSSQVTDTRSFKWTNTKNTLTINFNNGSGSLYYKIDHLSSKQLIIYSGDYLYSEFKLNKF